MAPTGPQRNADWPASYAAGTAARARLGLAAPAALNLARLPPSACGYTRKEDDRGNLTGTTLNHCEAVPPVKPPTPKHNPDRGE
jgi:hypothetical protein